MLQQLSITLAPEPKASICFCVNATVRKEKLTIRKNMMTMWVHGLFLALINVHGDKHMQADLS